MNPSPASAPSKPGWRSILLGLFVLFQVIYVLLANLIQLVPRELPVERGASDIRIQREGTATSVRPIQAAINGLGAALDRWGQASGQVQAWSLFAPEFGRQAVFPLVECYGNDGPSFFKVTYRPNIMPADPDNYCRWPSAYSRIAGYEFLLAIIYLRFSEESLAQRGDEWRQAVFEHVRQQQKLLEAYLRWNLSKFRADNPKLPVPWEMIVAVRIVPAPAPGHTDRPLAYMVPLARWLPGRDAEPGFLPIEAYDPVAKRFVRLPAEEGAR